MGFVGNYVRNLAPVAIGRRPGRPLLFSYYVTHRCGLECCYCCDGNNRPFKEQPIPELPLAEAKRMLELLRPDGDTLDITGGEPLAHAGLEEILRHARSLGFRTALNTKGVGLQERPEVLELSDIVALSVDALEAGRLATLLGNDERAARRVLSTLDWLLSLPPSKRGRLMLAAVATPDNLEDTAQVLRFAVKHDLAFSFSPQIVGRLVHPSLLDSPGYRALADEVIAAKKAGAKVYGVPPYLRGIRDFAPFRCYPLLLPTLRPDGWMVYPCLDGLLGAVDFLAAGSLKAALREAYEKFGPPPECGTRCQIFCHMALSLLQRHPLHALGELRAWSQP